MSARFFFTFGVEIQAVILGWQMYRLTHDPLSLGLIGLVGAVPALGLALYAGYIVDRSRPRVVYAGVLAGSLFSGLVLLVSQLSAIDLSARERVFGLLLSAFISGVARGFAQPAFFALLPKIVAREILSRANAYMTSALQIARIAGPALGGMVFGWWDVEAAAVMVCCSLVIAIVSLQFMQISPPAAHKPALGHSVKAELLSGARYVLKHPILLPALSLDMISVFFGGVTALLPIFADDVLHIGSGGLGLLRGAPALGAAITSIVLTRIDLQKNAGACLFVAVSGFGVCILMFGMSHVFWLSLVALGLSGAFDSMSMLIRSTAVQLSSPDSMRGRISAVNSIFIGSSNQLGELESGVTAKLMGAVPSVYFGGVVCLLTVLVTAIFAPSLRKLDLRDLRADG